MDLEAGREALRKELENVQRKTAVVEEECEKKILEFQTLLEDQARSERQTAEQRRLLETALDAATSQLADMRVEAGAARGRVEALETQLSRAEASHYDVELKLSSIVSALRRTVGILPGDAATRTTRSRSSSPRKGQRHGVLSVELRGGKHTRKRVGTRPGRRSDTRAALSENCRLI